MSERQTVTYGVPKRSVELAPGVLVRPQPLVSLCGHLQSLRYVGPSTPTGSCALVARPPSRAPWFRHPGLVGLLLHWGLFLCRCLMYLHGLRSTWTSWAGGNNAGALLVEFPFRDNMSHCSTPDLAESLGATPD